MNNTFAQFGLHFQETLMRALLIDKKFAAQMEEVIDVKYFDSKSLAFLADRYFQYSRKYKVYPTLPLLVTIIKDELKEKQGSDEVLCSQVIDFLQRVRTNNDVSDIPYVQEKSLEFCRKQALTQALTNAVEQMEANKYESIVDDIRKATMVGTTPSVGHLFFEDFEARYQPLNRAAVPTGIAELDRKEIFNGGAGKGELFCIVASTGVGKCAVSETKVKVRYVGIRIGGQLYKPWQKIMTKMGEKFARDITSADELL